MSSDFSWKLKWKFFSLFPLCEMLRKSLSLVAFSFLISKIGMDYIIWRSLHSEVPWCKNNGWEDILVKYKAKHRWSVAPNLSVHGSLWEALCLNLAVSFQVRPLLSKSSTINHMEVGRSGGCVQHERGIWDTSLNIFCYLWLIHKYYIMCPLTVGGPKAAFSNWR